MRKALLILTTLLFSGCISIYLPPPSRKPGEVITKQYISITVPESKDFRWTLYDYIEESYFNSIIIDLSTSFIARPAEDAIDISSYDIHIGRTSNASFEDIQQFTRDEIRKFILYQSYVIRRYYTYVSNVKCIAEIDNWFKYSIRCPYYNTKGDINAITVEADTSAAINVKIRAIFKPYVESVINSIKIHDMDIARMKKENRWFDKKFSIDDENHFVKEWKYNHDEFLRLNGVVDEDWLK